MNDSDMEQKFKELEEKIDEADSSFMTMIILTIVCVLLWRSCNPEPVKSEPPKVEESR